MVGEPFIVASRGRNPENPSDRTAGIHLEQRLEPNFSGCTNTLTTVQKDNYVAEPQVLRAERTEYGKSIRKKYEAGEVDEKIVNMREMKPRSDGISNTLTTVLKDNYVVEPGIDVIGNYSPSGHDASRIVSTDGLAPTVKENHGTVTAVAEAVVCEERRDEGLRFFKGDYCGALRTIDSCGDKRVLEINSKENLRIRKLTPKECWRLMGFDDTDFEKAAAVNSNSQLYKQAGNSIVVDVLCYIFGAML
jgi:site-specific DNA-cytosine methylase